MAGEFAWSSASPESQGMSGAALDAMREELAGRGTKALLIVRKDHIVYEWYAPDHGPKRKHYTASLAKALVGGMSLALALDDGLIGIDDPACKFIPEWKGDPEKSKITVRHLATHSSGVENAELSESERQAVLREGRALPGHMELPGWKGAFWRQEPNPFTIARDQAPVTFPPGTEYAYSNPGMGMLSYAVTASLKGSRHEDIRTLLRERIMRPIGVPDDEWAIGYGKAFDTNGLPLVANWGGGEFTARAVARLGRLMLRRGDWEGRQLVDPARVDQVTRFAGTPLPDRTTDKPAPGSGLCWWTNHDGAWRGVPLDACAGAGAEHQLLLVVPSLDLIAVRNGSDIGEPFWTAAQEHLFTPVVDAVLPPYPQSPAIADIEWAPTSEITRQCYLLGTDGSDNWPATWADDDSLYTAWGDGWGFAPPTEQKLSMGIARVVGDPPDCRGENVRSNAEFHGFGRSGQKASSLLMVNGGLYIWLRNVDGNGRCARPGWSEDHGRTWQWAEWMFEELGYCTFLNFGKNYAGARDGYVYTYSHDHPSAYTAADRMVLARVPKDRISERAAYEFFTGLDGSGRPTWSADLGRRAAVFEHEGHCLRSSVSYNGGLGRYLWWQQLPNHPTDPHTRFSGGFAVYDAPAPWGPWTTAFFTRHWDVGPGETGCFPTKWMSEDGRTVHLLFSGDDRLSVRRARLIVRESKPR